MKKVVLITGCSTGIGRDLAQRLAQSGCLVVATARNVESLDGLSAALKLPLDVTRPDTIERTVKSIIQQFGRIDVLVNNAGYAQCGAVEEVPDEQVHQMFDVNFFGVIRMMQAVLPQMRSQRSGRIINISSIAGKLSTPVNGAYSASKFALEALSDALRLELKPFGVEVSLIEPGAIKTDFDQTVRTHAHEILDNPLSPYRQLYQKYQQVSDGMRRGEPGPEVVSEIIQKAIEADHPKARYLAGVSFSARLVLFLRDWLWNPVVQQLYAIRHTEK